MKKWAFIDRSPTQNRASGGPSGSSRTSFRVLMYAACPLGRLPRFLPRLMKSEVKSVIARFLEPSSAPGFRAWKQTKRGRANRRGSLGQRHIGKSRNSLTCANENRIWRDFEVENRRFLTLSWTTPEARSTIPHASPEECLDDTPGKRKAGSLEPEGRILGRGVYGKTDLMQDWTDIEQERGIATAALSSDMPAVKHRNRLVACIAVIFVAAALLFAMPSLAYASSEASASPQGGEAQEILLQQQRSSKSVDITPNQPDIAPPPYTATDAYTTTSDKNSEVVAVSGDDASNRVGYTEDGKDSDDDSDDASSTEQNASDGANQNTGASDAGSNANSDDATNPDTADKSTGNSTGAPAIDDELATGDKNQSAQPTVDSDSKGKDVISTDGSQAGQREDLSSATSSSNRGEVQNQQTITSASDSITTQAGGSITQSQLIFSTVGLLPMLLRAIPLQSGLPPTLGVQLLILHMAQIKP